MRATVDIESPETPYEAGLERSAKVRAVTSEEPDLGAVPDSGRGELDTLGQYLKGLPPASSA